MRAAHRLQAGFGQTVLEHLALRRQGLHGPGHVFDGHLRIDAMLVKQVDAVSAQPSQLGVHHLPDVFGPAVQSTTSLPGLRIDVKAELGGHDDPTANALQGLAEDFLRHEGAIDLGGVEQRDAQIHRPADEGYGRNSVRAAGVQIVHRLRAAAGVPLDAHPDRKDLERPEPAALGRKTLADS